MTKQQFNISNIQYFIDNLYCTSKLDIRYKILDSKIKSRVVVSLHSFQIETLIDIW